MNEGVVLVSPAMATHAPAGAIPAAPGAPFAGGLYAGRFFLGTQPYALIVAPKENGELAATAWGSIKKEVTGALSCYNGLANTLAMENAGCKLGTWARELRIGEFDDWYIPSRLEALLAFSELRDQFERDWYWTSTQLAGDPECAWCQNFSTGYQGYDPKGYELRARAVRRVAI